LDDRQGDRDRQPDDPVRADPGQEDRRRIEDADTMRDDPVLKLLVDAQPAGES
jgi:hypothetical protein